MGKRREINAEQVAEIIAAQGKNKDKNVDRRLQAVLMYAQGAKRAEIMGRSKSTIKNWHHKSVSQC